MRNPYEVEPNFLTRQKYRDTTLLSDMLFETGSSTLDVTGADKLDSLLEAISINPIDSIIIVGHSDSIGSLSYNENLSLDRAKSVARYMEQRLTRPLKIKVISLAYFRPVAPNDTERGRARNRRVEIYIW